MDGVSDGVRVIADPRDSSASKNIPFSISPGQLSLVFTGG